MVEHRAASGGWRPLPMAGGRQPRSSPPRVFDGPINGARFLAWGHQALVPTLSKGDIVIMDTLRSPKITGVGEASKRPGAPPGEMGPEYPDRADGRSRSACRAAVRDPGRCRCSYSGEPLRHFHIPHIVFSPPVDRSSGAWFTIRNEAREGEGDPLFSHSKFDIN